MDTRWKYLTIEVKPNLMGSHKADTLQAELDRHAAQGWELAQIVSPAPLVPLLVVFRKPA